MFKSPSSKKPIKATLLITQFLLLILTFTITNSQTCGGTPFIGLAQCNTTCQTCSGGYNFCQTCPTTFLVHNATSSTCDLPQDFQAIYLEEIFSPDFLIDNTTQTGLTVNSQSLLDGNGRNLYQRVVCTAGSYKFDVLGIFRQDDAVNYAHQYEKDISQIEIRFRLISIVDPSQVEITVNNAEFYRSTIRTANLTLTNVSMNATEFVINIQELNAQTAPSLLPLITTGPKPYSGRTFSMTIQVNNLNNRTTQLQSWAIFDLVILAKVCQTCITLQVAGTSISLGIALGITGGLLIVLTLFLIIFVKIREFKQMHGQKSGDKNSLLKNRVVERVMRKKNIDMEKAKQSRKSIRYKSKGY